MKISYVATDLEFDSLSDPSLIVSELGKNISLNRNEQIGDVYYVTAGLGHPDTLARPSTRTPCGTSSDPLGRVSKSMKLTTPAPRLFEICR
jgi:hypothetical protein